MVEMKVLEILETIGIVLIKIGKYLILFKNDKKVKVLLSNL